MTTVEYRFDPHPLDTNQGPVIWRRMFRWRLHAWCDVWLWNNNRLHPALGRYSARTVKETT